MVFTHGPRSRDPLTTAFVRYYFLSSLPSYPSTKTMSSFVESTGKKLFAKHLEKYTPEDPLYEFYTDNKGKQKRRKVIII